MLGYTSMDMPMDEALSLDPWATIRDELLAGLALGVGSVGQVANRFQTLP